MSLPLQKGQRCCFWYHPAGRHQSGGGVPSRVLAVPIPVPAVYPMVQAPGRDARGSRGRVGYCIPVWRAGMAPRGGGVPLFSRLGAALRTLQPRASRMYERRSCSRCRPMRWRAAHLLAWREVNSSPRACSSSAARRAIDLSARRGEMERYWVAPTEERSEWKVWARIGRKASREPGGQNWRSISSRSIRPGWRAQLGSTLLTRDGSRPLVWRNCVPSMPWGFAQRRSWRPAGGPRWIA